MAYAQGLDPTTFGEFQELIGPERAKLWIEAFLLKLAELFLQPHDVPPDREVLFETAHTIVGSAGIMGCVNLVGACLRLQEACRSGAELQDLYLAAQTAARHADAALRHHIANPV